jgi:hypothetical protein
LIVPSSENITPYDSVTPILLTVEDTTPIEDFEDPIGRMLAQKSLQDSAIAKLIAGQPLSEDEAKAWR